MILAATGHRHAIAGASMSVPSSIKTLLIANRGEIAIRVMRAAAEQAFAPWRSTHRKTAFRCIA
jgi:pyruvate carboxylase